MKTLIKLVVGLVLSVVVLSVLLVAVLFFTVRDSSTVKPDYVDPNHDRSISNVINTELELASHDVKTTYNVDFRLDEEALEYLFTSIVNELNIGSSDVGISGVDIDVLDEVYNLEISGKILFFNTVIRCGLSFNETDEAFTIKLNNLKAGKLNFISIGKLFTGFIKTKKLESDLAEKNIYCDINLKKFEITFTKENIKKMLENNLGDEQKELVGVLTDIFLGDKDILELNLGKDNLLGAILHLNNIKYNGALPYNYDFDDLANKTKSLLDNELLKYDEVSVLYKYLVNGYSVYDEDKEKRDIIDNLDLSSIGINNNKTYTGILNKSASDSSEIISKHVADSLSLAIAQAIINRRLNVTITDDVLTEALKKTSLVGFSFAFYNDETNDVGYIVIEQLNLLCEDNKVTIDLIININGVQVYIEIILNSTPTDGLALTGTINKISIGSKDLSEANNLALIKYLETATSDLNWIIVNPKETVAESTIILNFTKIMEDDAFVNSFVQKMTELSIALTSETKIVDGGIVITYGPH